MQLRDKRVVVTGAGGALGRASSLRFAREGARVAVLDVDADAVEQTRALVAAEGADVVAVAVDVRDEPGVARAVETVVAAFGGLDVLFNNAGVMPHRDVSFLDADTDLWRTISDINLLGTVLLSKHGVPHLVEAGGGVVVNMGSFLSEIGCTVPQDAYAASKGAVRALTRSMAVQLGDRGVRVNALAPGPVLTAHVAAFFPDPEARRRRLERVPLGRFGTPEDVAGVACFLASDDSAWMTGQTLVLDGGISSTYI